jgi:hypothetical protein
MLANRVAQLELLKTNLAAAHNRMKLKADKNHTEKEFMVGDKVLLKLQPYVQHFVVPGYNGNRAREDPRPSFGEEGQHCDSPSADQVDQHSRRLCYLGGLECVVYQVSSHDCLGTSKFSSRGIVTQADEA